MNKIKEELRQKLLGQLSDHNTQLDIDNAYSVVKEKAVLFSLFCAENYMHTSESNFWQDGFRKKYTTEELFKIFEDGLD